MDRPVTERAAAHVEAYIRLEAATCERKVRQGLATAVWHDQLGEYCGTVSVRNASQYLMVIRYSALAIGSSGYAEGEKVLNLQRVRTNAHYSKPYFACPLCAQRVGQVILASEEWACRTCHGLSYRSQRLSRLQSFQHRLDALVTLLQPVGGQPSRPRYMRADKYAELSAEYHALRAALRGQPRQVPQRDLGLILQPTWRQSDLVPQGV